jgi:hypothetical protein
LTQLAGERAKMGKDTAQITDLGSSRTENPADTAASVDRWLPQMKLRRDGRCSHQIVFTSNYSIGSTSALILWKVGSSFCNFCFSRASIESYRTVGSSTLPRSVGRDWNVSIFQVPTQRNTAAQPSTSEWRRGGDWFPTKVYASSVWRPRKRRASHDKRGSRSPRC